MIWKSWQMWQMLLATVKDVSAETKQFKFSFPNYICLFSLHMELKKNLYKWIQNTPWSPGNEGLQKFWFGL